MKEPKTPTNPPALHIDSDHVRVLVNAIDRRTIIKRLEAAGVEIKKFGSQQVVLYDDILEAIHNEKSKTRYIYKGKHPLDNEETT